MIVFITFLRALAAIIITNSHYVGVYPNDIIANGGLLGDTIFFAVSGFCLYNIKDKFTKWYSKRIIRIYPAVLIITILYLMLGFYETSVEMNLFNYFVYPTYYHFIASIILLYIIYYLIIKNKKLKDNLPFVIFGIFLIQLIIYLFFYDKSYYHIDVVREPMIRFLFLNSMLLGAYFRQQKEKQNKPISWIILLLLLVAYFTSKLMFVKVNSISNFQIFNQYILFMCLYFIFKCTKNANKKIEQLPIIIKKLIEFIANITLEIYLVQYVIINQFKGLFFPINWIIITLLIIVFAYILHIISNKISSFILKEKK